MADKKEVTVNAEIVATETVKNNIPKTDNRRVNNSGRGFHSRSDSSTMRRAVVAPGGEFDSRLLDLARVVRVASGGKKMRFRAVVIVGNKMGKVGV
ncbi:MAG: hypothetical protein V1905_03640, partial [bacterium]